MMLPPLPALVVRLAGDPAPPEGWKTLPMKNGQVGYVLEETPEGKLLGIVLFPEEDAPAGDLKTWFERRAREMGISAPKVRADAAVAVTGGESGGRPLLLAAVRPPGSKGRARIAMYLGDPDLFKAHNDDFFEVLKALGGLGKGAGTEPRRDAPRERAEPATPLEKALALLPASDRAKPLPPADGHGVKVFIRNHKEFGLLPGSMTMGLQVDVEPLLLFPDGTAFDDGPAYPVREFSSAGLRAVYSKFDVGTWKIAGNALTVTWPERAERRRTDVYRRIGDSWTDDPKATEKESWDVYRRVVPATAAALQGGWTTSSFSYAGSPGGATAAVAAGSDGTLAFTGETYADARTSFVSVTNANVGDAYKGDATFGLNGKGARAGAGRFRLDGLLLTREFPDGSGGFRRGVELGFLIPFYDGDKPADTLWLGRERWSQAKKAKD